jgi:hypothetical protein
MITRRFKTITFLSAAAMILHGVEEIYQHFYEHYTLFKTLSSMFDSKEEALFVSFQITLWGLLLLFYALTLGEKWRFRVLMIFGLILLYENQHLIEAVRTRSYYPGLITALIILPLSLAFWREIYLHYRDHPKPPAAERLSE